MIVEEFIAVLGFDLEGEQNIKAFNGGLAQAERGLTRMSAVMAGFVGGIAGAFAGQIARMAKDLALSIPGGALTTGKTFERFGVILETVEGSAEKARQSLDWVTEFTKKTPYELEEVTNAFVRMRAYGLDPTNGSFEAAGDAASAMGKGLTQAVEAVADAAQGEFERLKEFGIRASQAGDQVTLSFQKDGETVKKVVKKDGTEIVNAITEIWQGRFNGAMAKQAKTFDGIMSNISDNWTAFLKKVADSGYFEYIKRRAQDFLNYFNRLDREGTLDRVAKSISDGLVGALQTGERWFRGAARAVDFLRERFVHLSQAVERLTGLDMGSQLTALSAAALVTVARANPVLAALTATLLVLDDYLTYLDGGESIIGKWVDEAEKLPEPFRTLHAILTEIRDVMADIADAVERFKQSFSLPGVAAAGWVNDPRVAEAFGADPAQVAVAQKALGRVGRSSSPKSSLGRAVWDWFTAGLDDPFRQADVGNLAFASALGVGQQKSGGQDDFAEVKILNADEIAGMISGAFERVQGGDVQPGDMVNNYTRNVDFNQSNSVTIHQTVSGATAPGAAAGAVEGALDRSGRRAADIAAQEPGPDTP